MNRPDFTVCCILNTNQCVTWAKPVPSEVGLANWGGDKIAAISQPKFSSAFSKMNYLGQTISRKTGITFNFPADNSLQLLLVNEMYMTLLDKRTRSGYFLINSFFSVFTVPNGAHNNSVDPIKQYTNDIYPISDVILCDDSVSLAVNWHRIGIFGHIIASLSVKGELLLSNICIENIC